MTERTPGGDLSRQPPQPEQIHDIMELVEALAPPVEEIWQRIEQGSHAATIASYNLARDNGRHTLIVDLRELNPYVPDTERKTIGFVMLYKPDTSSVSYSIHRGTEDVLWLSVLRRPRVVPEGVTGLAALQSIRIEEVEAGLESEDIMRQLGYDRGTAADAEELQSLLEETMKRGRRIPPPEIRS